MALIKCIECGQMVSDKAKACPHCGYPLASNNEEIESTQHQEGLEQEYYYDFDDEDHSNYKTLWIILISILASVAIVGIYLGFFNHKTESLETVDDEAILEEVVDVPTVETVTTDLMNFVDNKDEAGAINLLDGLKKTAEDFLTAGDNNKYFNIINIIKTVWETNKDKILAALPALKDKMETYITPKAELKDAFDAFVSANGGEVITADASLENNEQTNDFNNTQVSNTKAKGTYMFEASRQNYKESYETYQLPNGGFGVRSKGYNTPDGYRNWTDYIVVMEDGRVVKIHPHESPVYIGKIQMISPSAFIIVDSPSNSSIGDFCYFYKGDSRNVGSLGRNGLSLSYKPVFDINEKRVYRNRNDYENRDIQESEYLIFSHVSQIYTSNDTEYQDFK